MNDSTYENFNTLEDYFREHPEEENDFYDDMAFLAEHDSQEWPEDWVA